MNLYKKSKNTIYNRIDQVLIQSRAERKYLRQKKENDILRNIYSSLVLVSKIDWSRRDRIRDLMLCNEDAPGVPESDLIEQNRNQSV